MGKRLGKRSKAVRRQTRRKHPPPPKRSPGRRLGRQDTQAFRIQELLERRRDLAAEAKAHPERFRRGPTVAKRFLNRNPANARAAIQRAHAYLIQPGFEERFVLAWYFGTFLPEGTKPNSATGFGSPAARPPVAALRLRALLGVTDPEGQENLEATDELQGSNAATARAILEAESTGYVRLTVKAVPEQERVKRHVQRKQPKRTPTRTPKKPRKARSPSPSRKFVRRGGASRPTVRPKHRRALRPQSRKPKPRTGSRKNSRRTSKAKVRRPRR